MATVEDKENLAPDTSSDPLQRKLASPSPKKLGRKGRSKSIGPGGLDEPEGLKQDAKQDAKNRRKSTYVPATKSIISTDIEKAERQAARRKTLANRRVSFAPEATLHTWDVVEFMRDQTTSTDSSDNTRRTSKGSPYKRLQSPDSDPPSTPPVAEDGADATPTSLAQQKRRRRSSIVPQTSSNDLEDVESSSVASGSSDAEESGEEDAAGFDDDTGTAMSLDISENNTIRSLAESDSSSTGSSARLEAALRQAAQTAGTRGIEYDEYGEGNDDGTASMELAGDEVTNAFKPWADQRAASQPLGSAALDQENVNPFSPAFKAQLVSGTVNRSATIAEEDTGDMSMDVTRAVGGIVAQPAVDSPTSQQDDATMDLTQAVGKIQQTAQPQSPQSRNGQKRRRSTTDDGSPGAAVAVAQSKRRRSSLPRSSLADDSMELTTAIGGIQTTKSPPKPERRRSAAKRRSSGAVSEQGEATMEFTQAIGGVKLMNRAEHTASSLDSNEELTMELTTVLGSIKAAEKASHDDVPMTPQNQSPAKDAQNTTPKDQERFKDAPDSGPKKLLTPMFQKQVMHSAEKNTSSIKSRKSTSPARTRSGVVFAEVAEEDANKIVTPKVSPSKILASPHGGELESLLQTTPTQSAARNLSSATPDSALKMQLDAQLQAPERSPIVQRVERSSPEKAPSTPEQIDEPTQEGRKLTESIKMMSTPRKDTLKNATPKKQATTALASPQAAPASRRRPTPKGKPTVITSPAKQLSEDLERIRSSDKQGEKVALQEFLNFAGIRFMDLTTTKRRMTHATTPSKAKKAGEVQAVTDEQEINLESAILAGGCTLPELEMYEHACHELKRYISDGKKVIKELEVDTAKDTPPLIQAYMAAGPKRKATIDTQMRDIKTQSRYRSKEMWYAWRTQLLEDLMKALQGIGEGLIKDDETLQRAEEGLDQVLPGLVQQYEDLQTEAERLEREAASTNEEETEELEAARERLQEVDLEMLEKQKILQELQAEMDDQQSRVNDLHESKDEFAGAIKEADRVKEACRGVSGKEITTLQESIHNLEETYGWSITSASSSPSTVTMTYKSQLQLYFHPSAFQQQSKKKTSNAPISLTHIANEQPNTTLRFFLQLLRASLQALPQCTTAVSSLLSLVSSGWETALSLSESERRLNLLAPTQSRIVSDERLAISTSILLPDVRSKVRVTFEVAAAVGGGADDDLSLSTTVEPTVQVVYGELYNEKKMGEFVGKEIGGAFEGWDEVVRELKGRLVARGAKGERK